MSKNSSDSSGSSFKFEQLSEEEISDYDSNRREELYQIFHVKRVMKTNKNLVDLETCGI